MGGERAGVQQQPRDGVVNVGLLQHREVRGIVEFNAAIDGQVPPHLVRVGSVIAFVHQIGLRYRVMSRLIAQI